jgi:hypothetical protein
MATKKNSAAKKSKKQSSSLPPAEGPILDAALGLPSGLMGRMEKALTRSRIVCMDGLSVSVQANEFTYCYPRENEGPYESVELGYPSIKDDRWLEWAEEPASPTETVYGRVPIGVVAYVIAAHGGRIESDKKWGARDMVGKVQPIDPAPKALSRLDMGASLPHWRKACSTWIQQAALGSPNAELAARFEVWNEGQVVLDWNRCMGCFLMGGIEAARENDVGAWVRFARESAQLELATSAGHLAPRRKTL